MRLPREHRVQQENAKRVHAAAMTCIVLFAASGIAGMAGKASLAIGCIGFGLMVFAWTALTAIASIRDAVDDAWQASLDAHDTSRAALEWHVRGFDRAMSRSSREGE